MDYTNYFYRIAVFGRKEAEVFLVDPYDYSKTTPLDSWLGTVVSLADGQHTVQELITYLGGHYPGQPPSELEKTIESVIERLLESEVIKVAENPIALPYYLATPANQQDAEQARKLMVGDGYIKQ